MDVEIEIPAVLVVLADQAGRISLIDRALEGFALADVFTAKVDVTGVGAHREGGNQTAFHEMVRIVTADLAVLAGTGL